MATDFKVRVSNNSTKEVRVQISHPANGSVWFVGDLDPGDKSAIRRLWSGTRVVQAVDLITDDLLVLDSFSLDKGTRIVFKDDPVTAGKVIVLYEAVAGDNDP